MIEYRKYYWVISLGIITTASIIGQTFEFYDNKGNVVALVDITLSTIALTIAIFEILMVRNIAESSRVAVNNALGRITEIISVSDISKGIKIAYDIQKYLKSAEYHFAHMRMQDLKSIIIPLKNDKRFETLPISENLPTIFNSLSIDISNVDSVITSKKPKAINIGKINGNLEELVSLLIEYENHIKSS